MLPAISPQEAFERFSKGEARLVDIRETDEYTQEFVPGSRLIPLSIIAKHAGYCLDNAFNCCF